MSKSIRRTRIAHNTSHVFGWALIIIGLMPMVVILVNAWTAGVSFMDISALFNFLWTNRFYIGFGIGFELLYGIIVGGAIILVGLFLLARRREEIREVTLITDDLTVTLECTVCRNQWEEHFSKGQLKSMGFPKNRTISRRKCVVCGRFTRPKITSI